MITSDRNAVLMPRSSCPRVVLSPAVMAGLVPAIHDLPSMSWRGRRFSKTWVAGSGPAMTGRGGQEEALPRPPHRPHSIVSTPSPSSPGSARGSTPLLRVGGEDGGGRVRPGHDGEGADRRGDGHAGALPRTPHRRHPRARPGDPRLAPRRRGKTGVAGSGPAMTGRDRSKAGRRTRPLQPEMIVL